MNTSPPLAKSSSDSSLQSLSDYLDAEIYIGAGEPILQSFRDDELAVHIAQAILLFNIKPKSAFVYLAETGVIFGLPQEVAQFLYQYLLKINKQKLGEYIGQIDDFNQCVCCHFFSLINFASMSIDKALRSLLRKFRLPGEAQQIDRILEKFGWVYSAQNNGMFRNVDTAYILAFSLILLNTDLHNHAIKWSNKMTLRQFIRNNAGIDDGEDLPAQLLIDLYNSICRNEIDLDEQENDNKSREFSKLAMTAESFRLSELKYFFYGRSRNSCRNLFYFNSRPAFRSEPWPINSCVYADGVILLDNVSVSPDTDGFTFYLHSELQECDVTVIQPASRKPDHPDKSTTLNRVYLRAYSRVERDRWVDWLQGTQTLIEDEETISVSPSSDSVASKDYDASTNPGSSSDAVQFHHGNALEELIINNPPVDIDFVTAANTITNSKSEAASKAPEDRPDATSSKRHRQELKKEKAAYRVIHDLYEAGVSSKEPSRNNSNDHETLPLERPVSVRLDDEAEESYMQLKPLPPARAEGWLSRQSADGNWKRRYYVLFPEVDGDGYTLFYYANNILAFTMKKHGIQTQQGYIRMRQVRKVEKYASPRGEAVLLHFTNFFVNKYSDCMLVSDRFGENERTDISVISCWFEALCEAVDHETATSSI